MNQVKSAQHTAVAAMSSAMTRCLYVASSAALPSSDSARALSSSDGATLLSLQRRPPAPSVLDVLTRRPAVPPWLKRCSRAESSSASLWLKRGACFCCAAASSSAACAASSASSAQGVSVLVTQA